MSNDLVFMLPKGATALHKIVSFRNSCHRFEVGWFDHNIFSKMVSKSKQKGGEFLAKIN